MLLYELKDAQHISLKSNIFLIDIETKLNYSYKLYETKILNVPLFNLFLVQMLLSTSWGNVAMLLT